MTLVEAADLILKWSIWIFNAGLAYYVFVSGRKLAKDTEVQEIKQRIIALEERVKNVPDHHAIAQMTGDMKAIRAEIHALQTAMSALNRNVDRVNDYLLSHKP